ncbi:hypothetical protein L325_0122405 [Yersinia pestis 9]|nr:hypothetical protein L325_0122405 [Yersinia pestis 9]
MPFFYLQIRKNHLTLKNLDSQKVVSGTANFSTERLLIGEFFIAEACYILWCHKSYLDLLTS